MKERKGDVRIYVISCFFFLCIVFGGVFLGLYIFLPETFSASWYPIAGLVLVGVPWIFWFLAYLYKCFSMSKNVSSHPSATATPSSRTPATVATTTATASCEEETPVQSPVSPGRHVHFGAVVVMGSEGRKSITLEDHQNRQDQGTAQGHLSTISESDQGESVHDLGSKKASVDSRESEIPLAYSSGC